MWLRVLKTVIVVAKATGLDSKVKGWVAKRLRKYRDKVEEKAFAKFQQAEALLDEVDPLVILPEEKDE